MSAIIVRQGNKAIANKTGKYDFGKVNAYSSSPGVEFTIENAGKAILQLTSTPIVKVSGTNAADFKADTTLTNTAISPGGSTIFKITFSPTSVGNRSATISIENNSASHNPYTFTVKGVGKAIPNKPEINVKQGADNIPCTAGSYVFGDITVGLSSPAIEFTIENLGSLDLNLTGNPHKIAKNGVDKGLFSVNQTMTVSPVVFGSSTIFTITFQPTSQGIKSTTIVIPNNDSDENPYEFIVTGKGITSTGAPEINVKQGSDNIPCTTGSYDFGNLSVGDSSSEITFTIENTGNDNLLLSGNPKILKSGTDTAMFGINQTLTTSPISGGNSTTFSVKFTPSSTGSKSATISIANNDSNENPYIFAISGTGKSASGPTYCWTKRIGGTSNDQGRSLTNDASGNVYITGDFSGTVDFGVDFSVSDSKTTAGGGIFVTKINANGIYGWTKRMGGTSGSGAMVNSITTDTSGNVYLTGRFQGTVDFGDDFSVSDSKTSAGSCDIFVTKINANGTYGRTKRIGGTEADGGYSITTDASGNIYITGSFGGGSVNFGDDFGVNDIKSVGTYAYCGFVTKINSNGSYGWTKRLGYSGKSITNDNLGNIYIIGSFFGSFDFGADFGLNDIKTGSNNPTFITKINSNGTYGWTKKISGINGVTTGNSITTDSLGNIYLTGGFAGTVDFGSDFGISDIKSTSGWDSIFITKINSSGIYGWTKKMGGADNDVGTSITTDSSGNVYLTGYFSSGTVYFGADFGNYEEKYSSGYGDIFITKINANGTYGWTKKMGGSGYDCGASITSDTSGNIYLTGCFDDIVNFAADFGSNDLKNSLGNYDIFITKITP